MPLADILYHPPPLRGGCILKYIHPSAISIRKKMCRRNLKGSFQKMSCFLMPYPGEAIMERHFQGAVKDISPRFISHLKASNNFYTYYSHQFFVLNEKNVILSVGAR
jgi:hypothetical protein